jgi:hypothetical protein
MIDGLFYSDAEQGALELVIMTMDASRKTGVHIAFI